MMGLGLGGLGLSGMGGVPPLARYAVGGVLPSAVMDFETGFLSTPLSLARASTATYVDADGTIKTAAVDAPRFDWSTGRRALLLEGSTTNFVQRSSHTAAYPWTTTTTHNGITATMVASGTLNGVPYADYALTGTATNAFTEPFVNNSNSRASGAAVGQTWTASVYVQLVSGVWPAGVVLGAGVYEEASGNVFLAGTGPAGAPVAAITRFAITRTLNQATVATVRSTIALGAMTAGVTTFTGQVVRLFGWQLEQNASATSLIQSLSGVATTRAADVVAPISVSGLSAGYTLVVEGQVDAVAGNYDRIAQLDTGSDADRQPVYYDKAAGAVYSGASYGAVSQTPAVGSAVAYGAPFKSAFAIGPDHFQGAVNGAVAALDNSVQYAIPSYMRLAQAASGAKPARLLLSRVAIYPSQLTGAQLIEVTA